MTTDAKNKNRNSWKKFYATIPTTCLFATLLLGTLTLSCGQEINTRDNRNTLSWFVDVTAKSGIDFQHHAGVTPEKHLPETMGGGGLLADLDGDGDLDVYLIQSGNLAVSNTVPSGEPNRLYLNRGNGIFDDHTEASGAAAHTGYGQGVAAGDVDLDGDIDLYVTNFGPDILLLNDGTGTFSDGTSMSGLGDTRWTAGASFFDADQDGDMDLYVTAYLDVDLSAPVWCGRHEEGWRSYCNPDVYEGLPDRFWLNLGDGTFKEATDSFGLNSFESPGKGLGAIPFDFNGDGAMDLYVANDSVENRLWVNTGNGFRDGTLLSGTGVNSRGLTEAGMGLAAGDVDGDLDLDLFVTNFDDESNTLYRNDGDGFFTDVTLASGLEAPSRLPVGFGAVFADFDLDGDLDLAVANGHIINNIHLYHDGKTHAQRAQIFENDGHGLFREVSEQAGDLSQDPTVGRGLYGGDVDNDGDIDLLLLSCDGKAKLFENQQAKTNATIWITLQGLPQGTSVTFTLADGTNLQRQAGFQPSYYGGSLPDVHVGLPQGFPTEVKISPPHLHPTRLEWNSPIKSGVWRVFGSPDGTWTAHRLGSR
ncbi:MAG: VCBS repeat-containing protein [Planctomycetota bacterium]|nr:VCBS repeat-containing protein [Planctomycetota bacterium]